MKTTALKITGLAFAAALTALTARAEVSLNQNIAAYGYISGLAGYTQYASAGGNSDTSLDINAAKLGLAFDFAPVTAKFSIYNDGSSSLYLLEANATYDLTQGWSITGGRFQSWLGYEPFDVPNNNFITNGKDPIVSNNLIPNFHEGVHVDYKFDKNTIGVAIVDSIYNGDDINGNTIPYRGDGKLSDGYGVEAHYGYNDGALSIGATLAYQNTRSNNNSYFYTYKNTYVGDLWAQYIIDQKTTLAAEIYYKSGNETGFTSLKQYYGLVTAKQQFTDLFSLAGRISAGSTNNLGTSSDANFWKISVTPACTLTKNLVVAAELNYTKYNQKLTANGKDNNAYLGVLACFHF